MFGISRKDRPPKEKRERPPRERRGRKHDPPMDVPVETAPVTLPMEREVIIAVRPRKRSGKRDPTPEDVLDIFGKE